MDAATKQKATAEGLLMLKLALVQGELEAAVASLSTASYVRVCEKIEEAIGEAKEALEAARRLRFRDENEGSPVALITEAMTSCIDPMVCGCDRCNARMGLAKSMVAR